VLQRIFYKNKDSNYIKGDLAMKDLIDKSFDFSVKIEGMITGEPRE